ncbi:hypothetical protein ACSN7D_001279 [Flavobacterium psychrophilum]|uniref:Uncharacterized protein n=1 Tax=Flavobacterium psychrophilum (strain ATCC 49511 / DSM 21280 / CIP 103535 / JIP02/86) TaxID=402612 RepID=A6GXV4_FLAPJ|nr:hypothetical protein [Flavobacterium psychrophilum]AIT65733.1 hypothetical protein IB65_07610 [Flavobacterium psychrophilum]AKC23738.1 hypothetical protein IY38_04230 [Flavobacterium psychrophilum]EKT3974064.1 hypothetical protein [Flavobacterium psychrophilum]EKT4497730.1 hypothetical protein [Flavobacterium psychrophilum]EKT4549154.1 hypothetical protein [Flavobacterium psychrophilum]
MEKVKYFKIRGTLVRASSNDFIDDHGIFIEEKIFFVKNIINKKFETTYKISSINSVHKDILQLAIEKYTIAEFTFLLEHDLIYKLSDSHNELDFKFYLIVKTATIFDVFYNYKWLKINACYYEMNTFSNTLTGPYYFRENDDIEKIKILVDKSLIYIPTKKQTFESLINKKSA